MVNPRYRPTVGNSRKPVGSKAKTIHPEDFDKFKVELVLPPSPKSTRFEFSRRLEELSELV